MKLNKSNKLIVVLISIIAVTSSPQQINAQNLAAYTDYKNAFNVFDDGVKTQLDHRKAISYKVGYNSVAYINSQNELWVYQNGKQNKVIDWIKKYQLTDNLLTFGDNGFLNVYDNGKYQILCSQTTSFKVSDSIIAFYDDLNNSFEIYYNNKVHQLETDLLKGIWNYKVGENIMAYVNPQNYFLAFYRGEIIELMYTDEGLSYKVGLNTIAYIDPTQESFHVVYNGKEEELEEYTPLSYQCGDNMVTYITMEGEFIQYYKGSKMEISSFAPDFYKTTDNMLVYGLLGRFYAFYEGQNYELANFIPTNYQFDKDAVAFVDQQGKLWYFNKGEKSKISIERVTGFELIGNTLHYDVGSNTHKILFKGKTYSY